MSLEPRAAKLGRGLCLGRAVLELAVVLFLVVMAVRLDDEAVVSEGPFLEPGDPHSLSGTARPRVPAQPDVSSARTAAAPVCGNDAELMEGSRRRFDSSQRVNAITPSAIGSKMPPTN